MPSSEPGVMTQHWPSRLSSASDQVAYSTRGQRVICIRLTSFRPIHAQVMALLSFPLVGHRDSCKKQTVIPAEGVAALDATRVTCGRFLLSWGRPDSANLYRS